MSESKLSRIVLPLLQWYDRHARILPWRDDPEPYSVWISEIMLQQTRVEAVKPYFDRWMKAFPDLPALADASEAEVLKLWEGLGYYSRARNIHKTAKLIMEQYNGMIPSSYEELRKLPGIGEYTAGSVGSIAFRLPVPCVDGNVLRVITRITAEKADIGSAAAKKLITGWVSEVIPKDRPGDFNQALMELGATVCLPNGLPKCESCPLSFLCQAKAQNLICEIPVKSGKPSRRVEHKTILVLLESMKTQSKTAAGEAAGSGYKVALRKRPDSGLLAGLWEFPSLDSERGEEEIRQILTDSHCRVSDLAPLKRSKHIFTHIEWEMTGYLAVLEAHQFSDDLKWVELGELEKKLALPAAFKHYYQSMKRYIDKESLHENNQT